jgi:hypothetical protein
VTASSGRASTAGREPASAHSLTWVDLASGEPLRLELCCDEAFAHRLESTGFVRVASVRPESGDGEQIHVDSRHAASAVDRQSAQAPRPEVGSPSAVEA